MPFMLATLKLLSALAVTACLSAVLPGCNRGSASTSNVKSDPAADSAAHPELFKSAESGNAEVQTRIGLLYYGGIVLSQNKQQAAEWLRKAAVQGYAPAQHYLGEWYQIEQAGTQGNAQAMAWFRKAADQGYAPAQYGLANLYHLGRGTAQDEVQAAAWYRKAADQGYALAQRDLGYAYSKGIGIGMDPIQAHMWLSLAGAAGMDKRGALLRETELRMSPEQIRQAKELAKAWKPANSPQPPTSVSLVSLASQSKSRHMSSALGEMLAQLDSKRLNDIRNAAEKGDADDQFVLGIFYLEGNHVVVEDINQAVFWLQKSAAKGNQQAQAMLGILYSVGKGVNKDLVQAYKWLTLGMPSVPSAKNIRHQIEFKMTPGQIEQADAYVQTWKPN